MQLGHGRIFYPLDPRPEEVFITDIARSLSRIMRYNGHSDKPISVAQHSMQAGYLAIKDKINAYWVMAILMHDAAEAYVGDVIRPMKIHMPRFREIEDRVDAVIKEALNIPHCPPEVIKHYDNLAWAWEKRDLFKSSREWPATPKLPDNLHVMTAWPMADAEGAFVVAYDAARRDVDAEDEETNDCCEEEDTGDFWPLFTESRDWRDL